MIEKSKKIYNSIAKFVRKHHGWLSILLVTVSYLFVAAFTVVPKFFR